MVQSVIQRKELPVRSVPMLPPLPLTDILCFECRLFEHYAHNCKQLAAAAAYYDGRRNYGTVDDDVVGLACSENVSSSVSFPWLPNSRLIFITVNIARVGNIAALVDNGTEASDVL